MLVRVPSAARAASGQAFHVPQRVRGLGGPAPLALRGGVGHGLQFAQRMRVAQGVPGHAGSRCHRAPRRHGPAIPAKTGSTPAASIACRPLFGWTVISAYLPADAEWTQASFPATRNPVSSKCATSRRRPRADRLQRPAQRRGDPGHHRRPPRPGTPGRRTARPSPARCGPGTGTGRATGTRRPRPAAARTAPGRSPRPGGPGGHRPARSSGGTIIRCSVTTARTPPAGRSPAAAPSRSPARRPGPSRSPAHRPGSCTTTSSG